VSDKSPGNPQISVVTPLFNCLAVTQAMVASLRASIPAGISYEVILVDDGSTDGTREWLAGLGEPFRVVLNDRNLGYGAATNRGAAVARGRILALLNNDLVLGCGWLEPMLAVLKSLGRKAGLVGNIQVNAASGEIDHSGIVIGPKFKPEHDRRPPGFASLLLAPARRVFAVTGACVLIRTNTWRSLGGFDESYINGCEDIDLCLRAREAGLKNAVALRSRVLHHVSSSPGRKLRDEENTRRLVLRWRPQFVELASRTATSTEMVREYFWKIIEEPRDIVDTAEPIRAASFLLRLRHLPPDFVLIAKDKEIDHELAHWRNLLSH
jgi:GT2 family glycosyltransferase